MIDAVLHPRPVADSGQPRPTRWHKRPVSIIRRTFIDPLTDLVNFRQGQLVPGFLRRHPVVGIGGGDAGEQLALAPIAGNHRRNTLALGEGTLADVEP